MPVVDDLNDEIFGASVNRTLPADERRRAVPGHGGYLVRNRRVVAGLSLIDSLPWPRDRRPLDSAPPRRLLLSMFGHLGDCVIATATLQRIADLLPQTEIGVLVGSWSAVIFRNDPRVAHIHIADHWRLNRAALPLRAKLARYAATRRTAIQEMKKIGYDTAIDLYYHFPPAGPLLRAAGIPKRIGYESGGFRRFLTHSRPWVLAECHVADYQAALLTDLGIPPERLALPAQPLRPSLPGMLGPAPAGLPERYVVMHMGVSVPEREWPEANWREVIMALDRRGIVVVLTGAGQTEAARCARIVTAAPSAINLCDALDLPQLRQTIAGARLLLCGNTLVAHLGAADHVPSVVLWAGVVNPAHWRPLNENAVVLHSNPSCLPCYEWRGCPAMTCIRGVGAERVLSTAFQMLGLSATAETP